jgi:DNA-directed RNA polymerase subunit omega
MMIKEKGVVETCLLKISDPFTLVVLAAYRAQELASGVTPCVPTDGSKDALVSLKEISSGKLDMESLEDRMIKSLQKFAFLSEEGLSDPVDMSKAGQPSESASFIANALFQKPAEVIPLSVVTAHPLASSVPIVLHVDDEDEDLEDDIDEDEDYLDLNLQNVEGGNLDSKEDQPSHLDGDSLSEDHNEDEEELV